MKLFKIALVALVLLVNLVIAKPSLAEADMPRLTNNPDYLEVTQAINDLNQAKSAPDQSMTPEEIQQKLGDLRLEKYILETAEHLGQCRNETGKTLAVYAHKPKKSNLTEANTLYFLGNGQITDDDWDCDGVYLPSGVKVAGLSQVDTQELQAPVALKIVDGTQFIVKTNPNTGAVEFNVSPAKTFKTGEASWAIPNLSQAEIDSQVPNAPIED